MKNMIKLFSLAALFVVACGDNHELPDAKVKTDGKPADAYCADCPAAPTLGAQLDRIGRPAINTVLNHGFDGTTAAGQAKDDYNADGDPAAWQAYIPEFKKNLGIIDALDTGVCGNGICELGETVACADCSASSVPAGNGCGNQVYYNAGLAGGASETSYQALASVLAADELYLDTAIGECTFYLAVEFGVVRGADHTTCGGRALQYDVIDYSLSALAQGVFGLDVNLQPKIKDGAGPHDDYLTDFPFLGPPHS